MKFLISSNPDNLQAVNPDASVEAEYGDRVVTGRILTMAHHGPRAGQPAPCSYGNGCGVGVETVALSHVDLDTIGGCMALLGLKLRPVDLTNGERWEPYRDFWALAEFVDLNGAHKLGATNADPDDLRRLYAYWAFSRSVRVYAPRDGSVLDVTTEVLRHVEALARILSGDAGLLLAGSAFRADEDRLNRESYKHTVDGTVILRSSTVFVNHLYVGPFHAAPALAVVTHNPGSDLSGGAITMSLADPVEGVHVGKLLAELFGPEAGGHAGIGGSPRGKALPFAEAERVAKVLAERLAAAL